METEARDRCQNTGYPEPFSSVLKNLARLKEEDSPVRCLWSLDSPSPAGRVTAGSAGGPRVGAVTIPKAAAT